MALKATETLQRCSEDLAQSPSEIRLVRTLQMVRLKNCQIQTGTHKTRDLLLSIWLLASLKVNMIQKCHCLHRDFSKFSYSHNTKTVKSVIYCSLTIY